MHQTMSALGEQNSVVTVVKKSRRRKCQGRVQTPIRQRPIVLAYRKEMKVDLDRIEYQKHLMVTTIRT